MMGANFVESRPTALMRSAAGRVRRAAIVVAPSVAPEFRADRFAGREGV